MKRILKFAALTLPVLLFIGFMVHGGVERSFIDQAMRNANGIVWKDSGGNSYRVDVSEKRPSAEIIAYKIEVFGPAQASPLLTKEFRIDQDMYGGGFLRAVQADGDPEPEILAFGVHESEQNFFIDFDNGAPVVKPFDEASPAAKTLARKWSDYNLSKPMETIVLGLLLIGYYALYGIGYVIFGIIKKKKAA